MPRGVPDDRALPRRVAIVAALCAVTAIGLQARAALAGGASASAAMVSGQVLYDIIGAADGAAFIAAIVLLVVVFRVRREKREADRAGEDEETPRWVRVLSVLLSITAVGLPLWLIGYELRRKHIHGVSGLLGGGSGIHHRHGNAVLGSGWSVFSGMAIAAVALIVAGVIMLRHRARDRLSPLPGLDDQPASLDDALSAGAAAIVAVDDPRAAIIACYAAMEQNLAGAGAAPAAADTPGEVLTRATATGLIRSAAADQLTGLFRQARYGGRDMTEADRAAAQQALARLRAELGSQSNGAAHRPELDGAR